MKTLRPKKYKEEEFFIADEVEISSFRDELASMEHPFFALKGGDDKVREYRNNNISVLVRPATGIGLATVFDKDIWIYAISKLQQAIFEGKPISRTIAFTPYEFFVTTNRDKGGRSYDELKKALERLAGTRIQTNIVYSSEKQETENFGLIDKWRILEEKKGRLDIGMVEVTLPDWLYQGITKNKVLKINSDYFRIRKAIDRRIYEIARKHCGYQKSFSLSIELLHLKSGATSNKREFKRSIKKLSLVNDLPDY
ncbi:replication initiator protein A [Morganella morganii]